MSCKIHQQNRFMRIWDLRPFKSRCDANYEFEELVGAWFLFNSPSCFHANEQCWTSGSSSEDFGCDRVHSFWAMPSPNPWIWYHSCSSRHLCSQAQNWWITYIGKTKSLKGRFSGGHKAFLWAWLDKYNDEDVRIAAQFISYWENPALLLELEAIILRATEPPYNVQIPTER